MSTSGGTDKAGNLLVLVIDINPSVKSKNGQRVILQCLDGMMVFCNTHLMMSPQNSLAVVACHTHSSCFLYPPALDKVDEELRPADGQYELFAQVNKCVKENLKTLVLDSPVASIHTESLLAGAMSMALCYVNRLEKNSSQGKLPARILVVTASGDTTSQYLNFMNVFFTAQKMGVLIDACVLENDCGLLQQGCDITGGMYLKIANPASFLEYLLWMFLPNAVTRKEMVLPPPIHVDYRAACFCHRNLIEIGYVCSVCLSIFCSFSPICSTCQAAFKFMGPLPPVKVKKKKPKFNL